MCDIINLFLTILQVFAAITFTITENVNDEMAEVASDVLGKHHIDKLSVMYKNNVEVDLGAELTPFQVKEKPDVKWDTGDDGKYYTLVMYDPDFPNKNHPVLSDVNQWLIVNIPGTSISEGDEISEYMSPAPPKGTGLHRYVFLVYEQDSQMVFNEKRSNETSTAQRLKFSVKKFAKKYNLTPYAGSYFQAKWDSYVTDYYRSMGNVPFMFFRPAK